MLRAAWSHVQYYRGTFSGDIQDSRPKAGVRHFTGSVTLTFLNPHPPTMELQSVYTEYPDATREREAWLEVVARLKAMTKAQLRGLAKRTGLSFTTLKAVRAGRLPHAKNRARLIAFLTKP